MSDLTKLVLVRHAERGKSYLFEAPVEAPIYEGDTVVCQLRDGKITYGIAVAITVVDRCSTEYRFISISANAIEPLSKIVGKYIKVDF